MSLDDEIIFMRMISEYFHDEEKLCQPFKHKAKRNFIILLAKKKGNFMKGNFVWFLSSDASRVLVACYAPLFFLFLMPWILWEAEKTFPTFCTHEWLEGFCFFRKTSASELRCNETRLNQNVYENLWKTNFKQEKFLLVFPPRLINNSCANV